MKLPSKVTPYSRSTLSQLPLILKALQKGDKSPASLYKSVGSNFTDVNDFSEALSCLYVLGKIDLLYPEEVIHLVG